MPHLVRIVASRARVVHVDPTTGQEAEAQGTHMINMGLVRWVELPPRRLTIQVWFSRTEALRIEFRDEHAYTEVMDKLSVLEARQGGIS